MIEVMVVLMELLLALELVQSRAHPTCGGGHGVVCTPFCWGRGGEPSTKFCKRGP